jgi:hypothetical protein
MTLKSIGGNENLRRLNNNNFYERFLDDEELATVFIYFHCGLTLESVMNDIQISYRKARKLKIDFSKDPNGWIQWAWHHRSQ